jgi:hypothetical protein
MLRILVDSREMGVTTTALKETASKEVEMAIQVEGKELISQRV